MASGGAIAQSDVEQLTPILAQPIQTPDVTAYQLRQYLMGRVAPLPVRPARRNGPRRPTNPPPPPGRGGVSRLAGRVGERRRNFEEAGVIEGNGYRIRKFRYEIVPGFQSAAYSTTGPSGRQDAGDLERQRACGTAGKAIEYKQKRCINYAKHGILALSLEWLAFGELTAPENDHAFAAHLDLVGMNGVGLFYLAMRRGLDYLYEHPNTDRSRLGVTGLSGGGWQTILLSSLDERVVAAIPVAGFAGPVTAIEHPEYIGTILSRIPRIFATARIIPTSRPCARRARRYSSITPRTIAVSARR